MKLTDLELKEHLVHFQKDISLDIKKYAIDTIFKASRYIFTSRLGKQQYGYCTHCSEEFKTNGLRHKTNAVCPKCKSDCIVKASGRGRMRMVDEAYFVYYEKSVHDPKVIVARGIYAVRDYSGNYHFVKTLYLERAWYIFQIGNSVMIDIEGYYSQAKTMQSYSYNLCKSVFSLYSRYDSYYKRNISIGYSKESIQEAVKGTPFSWSGWESYKLDDMVKFFDLFAKYPCIEYLTKLGFKRLVEAKLLGNNTYSSINWRGKTLFKVLKLSKKDLNEIKASNIALDPLLLRLYQIGKKDQSNLTIAQIDSIETQYGYYYADLLKILKHTTLGKVNGYITKQFEMEGKPYYRKEGVLTAWKDYLEDCYMLDMYLTDERVVFPKNLYTAHQETIKRVKTHESKLLDTKIQRRLKSLEYYCFEDSGLLIRPAVSTKELIAEGKTLIHCVGNYGNGYMTKYAKGTTNLLVIRKASEPEVPYYTVQLSKDTIIQVHGYKNSPPNALVSKFIDAFKLQKLTKKISSNKTSLAIPA